MRVTKYNFLTKLILIRMWIIYVYNVCGPILTLNKKLTFLIVVYSLRIQSLESELISRRSVDYEEMTNLEKTIEQVEDNLKRSTVSISL